MALVRKDAGGRAAGSASGPSRIEEARELLERAYAVLIEGMDARGAREHFVAAADVLEHCVRWNPEDTTALRELGRVRCELGQQAAAATAYRKVFRLAGDNPEALLTAAQESLFDIKEDELAREILEHVPAPLRGERWTAVWNDLERRAALRKAFPLSGEELLALKEHLFDRGIVRLEAATPRIACGHTLRETDAWLTERGRAAGAAGAVAAVAAALAGLGARCDCEVLLNVDPLDPCDTLAHWKAFAARRAFWRREAKLEALFAEGRAFEDRAEHERALAAFDAALVLAPDRARLHLYRARGLQALHRWEEALAACDRAAELAPEEPAPHFARAEVLLDLERPEEAAVAARRAIARAGDAPPAEAFQTLASALVDGGLWSEALAELDRGLAVHADHAELVYLRGYCLFRLGRAEDARTAFEQARRLSPQEDYPWYETAGDDGSDA
ncbi:MAG: DUF2695 domain-containing protein [Planctomycetes bacterium]|nr:DUF2695 domain-containing protein [Planctomycetota bacterium]